MSEKRPIVTSNDIARLHVECMLPAWWYPQCCPSEARPLAVVCLAASRWRTLNDSQTRLRVSEASFAQIESEQRLIIQSNADHTEFLLFDLA